MEVGGGRGVVLLVYFKLISNNVKQKSKMI